MLKLTEDNQWVISEGLWELPPEERKKVEGELRATVQKLLSYLGFSINISTYGSASPLSMGAVSEQRQQMVEAVIVREVAAQKIADLSKPFCFTNGLMETLSEVSGKPVSSVRRIVEATAGRKFLPATKFRRIVTALSSDSEK